MCTKINHYSQGAAGRGIKIVFLANYTTVVPISGPFKDSNVLVQKLAMTHPPHRCGGTPCLPFPVCRKETFRTSSFFKDTAVWSSQKQRHRLTTRHHSYAPAMLHDRIRDKGKEEV